MSKFKKSIRVFLVVSMLLIVASVPVFAFTTANHVVFESGLNNSVRASFYANRNTGSNPVWGAQPNKHIKQCFVRLIEGAFDSGRVYSDVAYSISDPVMKTAFTSRWNNPFHTAYTYYGWNQYF
ncbi:MAG: hypothetical protein KGZ56_10155 [Dethiobacter sp.]|nr:hypothetical protein [Dethiobacter sp.]